MCEIAILNTESSTAEEISNAAMEVYWAMQTSLGVVGIVHGDGEYHYRVNKWMTPEEDDVAEFIEDNYDDCIRFIAHGRLATHGETNLDAAHPIEIDCDTCDIEHVLHNGIVYEHEKVMHALDADEESGHDYTTKVDSEVIAHAYGEVPDEAADTMKEFEHEPCYILLGREKFLVNTNSRYRMTTDGQLGRPHRTFAPATNDCNTLILSATEA